MSSGWGFCEPPVHSPGSSRCQHIYTPRSSCLIVPRAALMPTLPWDYVDRISLFNLSHFLSHFWKFFFGKGGPAPTFSSQALTTPLRCPLPYTLLSFVGSFSNQAPYTSQVPLPYKKWVFFGLMGSSILWSLTFLPNCRSHPTRRLPKLHAQQQQQKQQNIKRRAMLAAASTFGRSGRPRTRSGWRRCCAWRSPATQPNV